MLAAQMLHTSSPRSTERYRDRRLGLVVFGVVEILIGAALLGLVVLTAIAVMLAPAMADLRVVLPSMALYTVLAAVFITLGVGSIRARRWARELSLSLAWVWLITGVITMVVAWLLLPDLWRELAVTSGLSIAAARAVSLGVNLLLSFVYVLLPAGFVVFYRSPDVAATCHARDPDPGWAGRCPQRLLALSVAYGLAGLSVLAMPAYNWVFPFFGRLLSGPAGAACWIGVLAACIVLAWGTCRRSPWAWWSAVSGSVIGFATAASTFATVRPEALFAAMGPLADQFGLFGQLWPTSPWTHLLFWFLVWGSLLAYLIAIRKLFDPPLGLSRDEP